MMFFDYLPNIEWNYTDEGRIGSFFVLFSENQSEIDNFARFAQEKHSVPSNFAINPELPEKIKNLLGYDETKTILIANVRIFGSLTYEQLILLVKQPQHDQVQVQRSSYLP